ncbi:MAG: response regulator, partial [Candidatus Hydrothermarchaeaceae archaeon]
DEEDVTFVIKEILERSGHSVTALGSGQECLKMLKKKRPGLILLDVRMPGIDGWEVCRIIKEDKKTKNIPVAMLTVRTSDNSIKRSFEYAHSNAHINKPVQKDALLNIVNTLLKKPHK